LASGRRAFAFRAVAALYGATTVYFVVLFVRALGRHPHEIRTGVFGYALFTVAATYGLWKQTQWGRNVALIIALGTSALGVIATLSTILSHHGPLIGAIAIFVISTALTYVLTRRIFNPLSDDF